MAIKKIIQIDKGKSQESKSSISFTQVFRQEKDRSCR